MLYDIIFSIISKSPVQKQFRYHHDEVDNSPKRTKDVSYPRVENKDYLFVRISKRLARKSAENLTKSIFMDTIRYTLFIE